MSKRPDIDPADAALFREMVGEVKPIKQSLADIDVPKPPARARQREADEQQLKHDMLSDHLYLETGDELAYHQPGVQKNTLRKLRRGQYRIEAELDLHGHTGEEARQALVAFLHKAKQQNLRTIRIIHGKGLSQDSGPVLKPLVNHWLRQKSNILAFCSARPADGGTGAVYVLLKNH